MIINLEEHRRKRKTQTIKVEKVKIPVYVRVYMEENKLIGEFASGKTEVITDYRKG